MAGKREAGGEGQADRERGHEQRRPVDEPREEEQRGHYSVRQRHRHEGSPEPRPVRNRRQVGVEEVAERQLQRVLSAQAEGEDADLDRRDDSDGGEDPQAPFDRPRYDDAPQADEPERERPEEEREREE